MSCRACVYWDKQTEEYLRHDKGEELSVLIPASGLCMYPVPSWVGYGLTAAHDGLTCATYKAKEIST